MRAVHLWQALVISLLVIPLSCSLKILYIGLKDGAGLREDLIYSCPLDWLLVFVPTVVALAIILMVMKEK